LCDYEIGDEIYEISIKFCYLKNFKTNKKKTIIIIYCYREIKLTISLFKILVILPTPVA